ncbi:MAG: hypothetical protein HC923_11340, partial [Myxococcales bacterium]|nr:hypothetical protein [Myxococcales bacterium]
MRRSPVAVVFEPEAEAPEHRDVAEGLLRGLAKVPELDPSAWVIARARSLRVGLAKVQDEPPRVGPSALRWLKWEVPVSSPTVIAWAMGARLVAGPTAARPRALLALGLRGQLADNVLDPGHVDLRGQVDHGRAVAVGALVQQKFAQVVEARLERAQHVLVLVLVVR